MLLFDQEAHAYTLDGRPVPSVTQVLAQLEDYSGIPTQVLERKARLGTAVHKACELHLADELDEGSLHPDVAPYLDQFRSWLSASRFEPVLSERKVFSKRFQFAGTLDLFGTMQSRRVLIDIKTACNVMPTFGPQTAAYASALEECEHLKTEDRFVLMLTPKRFELVPMKNPADLNVFYAALTIQQWRLKHGKSAA